FKDQGIELDLITANGGDRVGALVLSGQVDLGLAGPEVAIYLYNSETPDKPVMFCSVNGTDGFFFVSREKVEPFAWDKLKNRRIIGWRPGSTPQLFFEYVLKQKASIPKPSRAFRVTRTLGRGSSMAAPDPHSLGVPRLQVPRLFPTCLPRHPLQTILR